MTQLEQKALDVVQDRLFKLPLLGAVLQVEKVEHVRILGGGYGVRRIVGVESFGEVGQRGSLALMQT
ncbi:hypothetical protein [Phytoactinopolyspora endophytica]|uniref:hypothetical protein n=1 Tax=Phytoactinopolyspora endophytica TaxID=1642495 RepID=UPI001F0DD1F1|nr:hypothetical protein [Phytoactinopolyspora endophytica]